jgi:hypothetical protein
MVVEGAVIAVYEAVVIDGEYQKDGEAIETFVSGPDGFTPDKEAVSEPGLHLGRA